MNKVSSNLPFIQCIDRLFTLVLLCPWSYHSLLPCMKILSMRICMFQRAMLKQAAYITRELFQLKPVLSLFCCEQVFHYSYLVVHSCM